MLKFLKSASVVAAALFLGSCSSDMNTDLFGGDFLSSEPKILPCPNVTVVPSAENITIFREGPGRDLVDVTFEGSIEPVSGECEYQDDESLVVTEMVMRINATKGPAASSQAQEFPFFIAISDWNRRILSKKVFKSPVEVPEGKRRGTVQEEIVHRIPVISGRSGADYTILIGFQLTREQLQYNQKTVR